MIITRNSNTAQTVTDDHRQPQISTDIESIEPEERQRKGKGRVKELEDRVAELETIVALDEHQQAARMREDLRNADGHIRNLEHHHREDQHQIHELKDRIEEIAEKGAQTVLLQQIEKQAKQISQRDQHIGDLLLRIHALEQATGTAEKTSTPAGNTTAKDLELAQADLRFLRRQLTERDQRISDLEHAQPAATPPTSNLPSGDEATQPAAEKTPAPVTGTKARLAEELQQARADVLQIYQERARLQEDYHKLYESAINLRFDLKTAKQKVEQRDQQITEQQQEIANLKTQIAQAPTILDELTQENSQLRAENNQLREQIAEQEENRDLHQIIVEDQATHIWTYTCEGKIPLKRDGATYQAYGFNYKARSAVADLSNGEFRRFPLSDEECDFAQRYSYEHVLEHYRSHQPSFSPTSNLPSGETPISNEAEATAPGQPTSNLPSGETPAQPPTSNLPSGAYEPEQQQHFAELYRREEERAATLRSEQDYQQRVMRLDNQLLSGAQKVVFLAVRAYILSLYDLSAATGQRVEIPLAEIAQRTGLKREACGQAIMRLHEVGLVQRDEHKERLKSGQTYTHIFVSLTLLAFTLDLITPQVRKRGHGGERQICRHCGSDNLVKQVQIRCKACGKLQAAPEETPINSPDPFAHLPELPETPRPAAIPADDTTTNQQLAVWRDDAQENDDNQEEITNQQAADWRDDATEKRPIIQIQTPAPERPPQPIATCAICEHHYHHKTRSWLWQEDQQAYHCQFCKSSFEESKHEREHLKRITWQ